MNKINLYGNNDIQGLAYKCVKQESIEGWQEGRKDSPTACCGAYSPTINGSFLQLLKNFVLYDSFNRKEQNSWNITGRGDHAEEERTGLNGVKMLITKP